LGAVTVTFPKATLEGLTVIPPVVPVPDSGIVVTDGFVLAVIDILPVKAPAVVGENFATTDVLLPAATESGNVIPVIA
jgi:hypothetical protein